MVINQTLPPQNIEAEESILGGILVDPEAMGRVVDLINTNAFYVKAHQEIYQAALKLYSQGQPTDVMTVKSTLEDHYLLEQVGGIDKLMQLVDRTVSAVNIDRYALLVMEKYLRRQLIAAGHEIVDLGFETTRELDVVLDESEKKIFSLTQKRPQEGLIHISDTMIQTFNELTKLQEQTALPGIETEFYELDGITGGLQRSDLIIIAGRPSMGKTAFGLGVAANIAKKHNLPVAIFSLEMSKEQLSMRLLASEAGIESNRLRSGRLAQNDYEKISIAMGTLSNLPIYIDDAANITVMQIRSHVRRLLAEKKGEFGLILIDYLQLMEGGGDNRVQELSKITRSLKGLAREVKAPVIALSQLSRAVESRTNKRPMMSDLRESGCLTGDTLIELADTRKKVPIKSLVGKSGFSVLALNESTMKLEKAIVTKAFSTGVKPVFCLKTRLGRTIKATANHKFLTIQGWKRLDELQPKEFIALPRFLSSSFKLVKGKSIRPIAYYASRSLQLAQDVQSLLRRERAMKLGEIVKCNTIINLAKSDIYWDEIISIESEGKTEVYDLTVNPHHNFIANNIIVHNSIEQDADLIMMLYRDEYYNPDTVDRGVAEIIVTKHRNGPTGTIKLLFQAELTKFVNMHRNTNY